jgi:hypothetical protein
MRLFVGMVGIHRASRIAVGGTGDSSGPVKRDQGKDHGKVSGPGKKWTRERHEEPIWGLGTDLEFLGRFNNRVLMPLIRLTPLINSAGCDIRSALNSRDMKYHLPKSRTAFEVDALQQWISPPDH